MCIVMALELGLVQALVAAKEGEGEEEEITADELAKSTGSDRLLTGAYRASPSTSHLKLPVGPPAPAPAPAYTAILKNSPPHAHADRPLPRHRDGPRDVCLQRQHRLSRHSVQHRRHALHDQHVDAQHRVRGRRTCAPTAASSTSSRTRRAGMKSAAEFAYGMPLWELFRQEPQTRADFVADLSGAAGGHGGGVMGDF